MFFCGKLAKKQPKKKTLMLTSLRCYLRLTRSAHLDSRKSIKILFFCKRTTEPRRIPEWREKLPRRLIKTPKKGEKSKRRPEREKKRFALTKIEEEDEEEAKRKAEKPKMQLITSVIDLEHDICVFEAREHLKYDSISGNLHQFFPSRSLSASLALVSSHSSRLFTSVSLIVPRLME